MSNQATSLAEVLQRLRNSIEWLRDGKPHKQGIGIADMVFIEDTLLALVQPAQKSFQGKLREDITAADFGIPQEHAQAAENYVQWRLSGVQPAVSEEAPNEPSDLQKLRFVYRVLGNFAHAPVSDRADAYAMVRELIESTWKSASAQSSPGSVSEEAEPFAFATHHDEPMLFLTREEAALYCDDDEEPTPLFASAQSSPGSVSEEAERERAEAAFNADSRNAGYSGYLDLYVDGWLAHAQSSKGDKA